MTGKGGKSWMILLLVALFLGASVTSSGPAVAKTMDDIIKEGTLTVGVIPYSVDIIKDPKTGEYSGVFIEAINYITKDINVKPVFKEFTWATFVAGLQAGQVDLSVASTYATMKRALAVSFTRPVYFLGIEGVAKKGDMRFNKPEDLNRPDITIAVTQGTGDQRWLLSVAPKAKIRALATGDLTQALVEVVAGHADVGISDSAAVNKTLAKQPSLQKILAGNTYHPFPIAWAVRKQDTDLLTFFNTALSELISSGKLKEWAVKYEAPWAHLIHF